MTVLMSSKAEMLKALEEKIGERICKQLNQEIKIRK